MGYVHTLNILGQSLCECVMFDLCGQFPKRGEYDLNVN